MRIDWTLSQVWPRCWAYTLNGWICAREVCHFQIIFTFFSCTYLQASLPLFLCLQELLGCTTLDRAAVWTLCSKCSSWIYTSQGYFEGTTCLNYLRYFYCCSVVSTPFFIWDAHLNAWIIKMLARCFRLTQQGLCLVVSAIYRLGPAKVEGAVFWLVSHLWFMCRLHTSKLQSWTASLWLVSLFSITGYDFVLGILIGRYN